MPPGPGPKCLTQMILWDMQRRPFLYLMVKHLMKENCRKVGHLKEAYMASVIDDDPAHSPAWHKEPLGQAATGQNRHLERKLAFEGKEKMATVVVREAIGT